MNLDMDQLFADLGSWYNLPANEVRARIERDPDEIHGYVVADVEWEDDDPHKWSDLKPGASEPAEMAVRDSTVYPGLRLAVEEGLGRFADEGAFESAEQRIYALVPIPPGTPVDE
jgi:hypothetical protein